MNTYVFVDNYYANKPGVHTVVYVVKAHSEEEAWQKFSKYAIPNFGLRRNSSIEDVKAHFDGMLNVYGPSAVYDMSADRI